jgi:hypothetical protein
MIEEFLKTENARIEFKDKWLYNSGFNWIVTYSKKPRGVKDTVIYHGTDLSEALKALKRED